VPFAIKDNNGSPFRIQAMNPQLAHDHAWLRHVLQVLKESIASSVHHNQGKTVRQHAWNA